MPEFGSTLRKKREALGISLDDIANETRISVRFLQAIENEEFQRLPGGVFNRGFIRTFAQRVGLDPNQAVAEYERLVRSNEPDEHFHSAPQTGSRRHAILYSAVALILVAIVIGFYAMKGNSVLQAPPG